MRNEATSSKSNILHVYLTFGPNQRRQQALSDGAFCQALWFVFQQHCVAPPTLKPHWYKFQTSSNRLLRSSLCSVWTEMCFLLHCENMYSIRAGRYTTSYNTMKFSVFSRLCELMPLICCQFNIRFPSGLSVSTERGERYMLAGG